MKKKKKKTYIFIMKLKIKKCFFNNSIHFMSLLENRN